MIKTGSDFSGVGAFDQALSKLKIDYKTVYACDMDKYARQTYIENYGEPDYYPENVYDREIPKQSLDIYMTSPPCQSFSLAGKRLLSDAKGRTFQIWLDMLGGKSVNGNPVLFPREDATPYHIYHKVLNAKHFGVPQNRERVFIIGIRDDSDNQFSFPKPFHLTKRLKDVLENEVIEKFYLSEKAMNKIIKHKNPIIKNETPEKSGCIHAGYYKMGGRDQQYIKVTSNLEKYYLSDKMIKGFIGSEDSGYINQDTQASQVHSKYKESPTMSAGTHGYANGYVKVNLATSKGYETAKEGDSINLSQPNSETRRGRVEKQVAQTLDTACNQAVMVNTNKIIYDKPLERDGWHNKAKEVLNTDGISTCIHTQSNNLLQKITVPNNQAVMIGAFRGRNPKNPSDRTTGAPMEQTLEINKQGTSNTITSVQKDNVLIQSKIIGYTRDKKGKVIKRNFKDDANTIHSATGGGGNTDQFVMQSDYKIRRLTPRECFRLMDFPDSFTWPVSDTQAYKQAGNSIVVNVLAEIINKLKID